jgi:hypothetical protein
MPHDVELVEQNRCLAVLDHLESNLSIVMPALVALREHPSFFSAASANKTWMAGISLDKPGHDAQTSGLT